jgi:transcription elongation GreA/GreB family factor
MARTADHDAASPTTAPVLTPDGQRWLLERVAWLAAEPDQAGWSDDAYARGAAELARLNEILAQAITTEELPPERPGVVEFADEVMVEFDATETERFLLVDPIEAPVDDVRISVESPLAQALLGRRVGEQVEVEAPAGRYRCRIVATGRHRPAAASPATRTSGSWVTEGGMGHVRPLPAWEDSL